LSGGEKHYCKLEKRGKKPPDALMPHDEIRERGKLQRKNTAEETKQGEKVVDRISQLPLSARGRNIPGSQQKSKEKRNLRKRREDKRGKRCCLSLKESERFSHRGGERESKRSTSEDLKRRRNEDESEWVEHRLLGKKRERPSPSRDRPSTGKNRSNLREGWKGGPPRGESRTGLQRLHMTKRKSSGKKLAPLTDGKSKEIEWE